ncbi:tetratricopeptide repeat protein [Actinocorallia longicatena]|uniref:CRP-like cAMP-binding protein n=1 Tax=Actinocorallia longicatena TaxID=111803 RepID=A0ABP6Q8J3_9ACTN
MTPPLRFWDRLPGHVRQRLLTEHRVETHPARSALQLQGMLAEDVIVFRGGHALELRRTGRDGQPAVIGLLGPGDAAGLHVLSGHPQRADIVGVGRGGLEVLRIPQARFRQLAEEHREVTAAVLRTTDDRHTHEGLRLALALSPDVGADQRLAVHLVELAERFGRLQAGGAVLDVGLTQEELGRYAGVTRSRTNRTLSRFRERGLLGANWRYIADLQGLRHLAGAYDDLWSVTRGRRDPYDEPADLALEPAALPSGLGWPRPSRILGDVRHFTGRRAELGHMREVLLRTPGPRVAVLYGPSGSGKTALAARFGKLFSEHFPDCQISVDVRDHSIATTLGAILRALGVPGETVPRGEEELTDLYRRLVADRSILLVLDDAGDAEQVRRLLPRTPSCAVIVTSPEPLHGVGAENVPVGPLSEDDAVALVHKIAPSASETAGADLARLCEFHPLAVAVAAPGFQGLPPRAPDSSGLGSALIMAYRRLPDDRRHLFRFAALTTGPDFSVEALAALLGWPEQRASEELAELAHVNLVTRTGHRRFRQHGLLRRFALERVRLENNESDRDEAVERLLGYYLTGAQHHGDVLGRHRRALHHPLPDGGWGQSSRGAGLPGDLETGDPDGRMGALEWLERERLCLIAAVRVAAETGRHAVAYGLADACYDVLELQRFGRGNLEIHRIGLRSAQLVGDQRAIGHMLHQLGVVSFAVGRNLEAIAYEWMAAQVFAERGDTHGEAVVHQQIAAVYQVLDRHTEALAGAEYARKLHGAAGDGRGEATALVRLTTSLRTQGRYAEALECAELALDLYRAAGDRRGEADALRARADVRCERHQWVDTERDVYQALAISEQAQDGVGEAWAYIMLARISRPLGAYLDGLEHGRKALDLCRGAGDRHGEGWARIGLGRLLIDCADLDGALAQLDPALQAHTEIDHPRGQVAARIGIAIVLQRRGRLHEARSHLEQALSLARQIGDRTGEARALEELATTLRRLDQLKDAMIFSQIALKAWRSLDHRRGMATVLGGIARIHLRAGRTDEALEACDEAEELRAALGDRAGLGRLGDTRARVLSRNGRLDEALASVDAALPRLRAGAAQFHLAEACRVRASILLKLGRLDEAAEQAAEALSRARDLGDGQTESAALKVIGRVHQREQAHAKALDALRQADRVLVGVDDQGGRIPLLEAMAVSHEHLGDDTGAARCRRRAEELRRWLALPEPGQGLY